LLIGMSRRLFTACRNLAYEHALILEALGRSGADASQTLAARTFNQPSALPTPLDELDDEEYEEQVYERRVRFAEVEDEERARIRDDIRHAYDDGRERECGQLINLQPPVLADPSPGLLESATADTYIAIDTRLPPAGA
jgi:hypothetical protein